MFYFVNNNSNNYPNVVISSHKAEFTVFTTKHRIANVLHKISEAPI